MEVLLQRHFFSLLQFRDNMNIPSNKTENFRVASNGNTTNLFSTKGFQIMDNSEREYNEHKAFWKNAKGDVLITGLGIGFSHCNLVNNPNITSVTIIEKYQDVIDLVWDHCSKDDRFNLIHADANTWEIEGYWDCIWIDHWVLNISEDTIDDFIKSMTTKYSPHCSWLGFWLKERDKHEK